MKRDCDCHDDLGALNHVGDGRLDELYDEVLDEPEGNLGELEHIGASGVEWLDDDDLAGIELDDFDLEQLKEYGVAPDEADYASSCPSSDAALGAAVPGSPGFAQNNASTSTPSARATASTVPTSSSSSSFP